MVAAYVSQLEARLPQQDTARGGMAQDTHAPTPSDKRETEYNDAIWH